MLFTEDQANMYAVSKIFQKILQFIKPSVICFDDSLYISVITFC